MTLIYSESNSASPQKFDVLSGDEVIAEITIYDGVISVWDQWKENVIYKSHLEKSTNVLIGYEKHRHLQEANNKIRSHYSMPDGGYIIEDEWGIL